MSHQVTVDFEGLSISVQAQCENAKRSLCKIDKELDKVKRTADKFGTSKVKEYETFLLGAKNEIQSKIDEFWESLEKYKLLKTKSFDSDIRYGDAQSKELAKIYSKIKTQGEDLTDRVNELTGSKLAVLDQLVDENLLLLGEKSKERLLDETHNIKHISQSVLDKINSIDDVSLRELAYNEAKKSVGENIDFEDILKKAKEGYDILLGKKTAQVIDDCRAELKKNGVSSDVIKDDSSLDDAVKTANSAIIEEKVRKETILVILKAIRDRGFIVDTKKNLKIDRDRNVVKLVALKPSGQRAEFEIQINGKFMYRFEGYEGAACNKDIEPFMDDLENVYGIKVLHEDVQWSNPDKISTQKYQYANVNKGRK